MVSKNKTELYQLEIGLCFYTVLSFIIFDLTCLINLLRQGEQTVLLSLFLSLSLLAMC